MSAQKTSIEQGDLIRDEALKNQLLSSRYQQLDRALEEYKQAALEAPTHPEIKWRLLTTKFLSAGDSEEQTASAKEDAQALLNEVSNGSSIAELKSKASCLQILGDFNGAYEGYRLLSAEMESDQKGLAHTRFLARGLLEASIEPRNRLDDAFPPLRLVVFSGHMPPQSDMGCMPLIEKELGQLGAKVGVSSAAAGADLLFLDALHRIGGESHIILPWGTETFVTTSIAPFDNETSPVWKPLFDSAISNSKNIRVIGEMAGTESRVGWQYLMEVSAGFAVQIARESYLDIVPLAVWNLKKGEAGGTAAFCEFWKKEIGIEPKIIFYDIAARGHEGTEPGVTHRAQTPIIQQSVKSMLFTDVVGFSQLPENVIPAFVEKFLQKVSEVIAASAHAPQSINTWGDALYAVFDFVQDAGLFALELNKAIEDHAVFWRNSGLGNLRIRTGLHAGPVFLHHDPIVRRLGYSGAHVNRAARIEPIAEDGQIFASEEFAALAANISNCGFTCNYEGEYELLKNYPGKHRLFSLRLDHSVTQIPLAKAIHELYCRNERDEGVTQATNPSIAPWEDLPQTLQSSNLAQAEDIPYKLKKLGYKIVESGGSSPYSMSLDPDIVEWLAAREHDRWVAEKIRDGWKYGPKKDTQKRLHHLLIPYRELDESERQKDRNTVTNIPALLESVGYRISPHS